MEKLYEFTFPVVLLRLALAMFCGGIIGYGRSRRRKAAGFRTYMLVAIGGCMTVLMSLYYHEMMHGNEIWVAAIAEVGEKFDGVRFAAQAVTGIGFLASGTILRNPHQKVEGLTTAAGLLTTVCMGIAAGAGYYSLVICIFILLIRPRISAEYPIRFSSAALPFLIWNWKARPRMTISSRQSIMSSFPVKERPIPKCSPQSPDRIAFTRRKRLSAECRGGCHAAHI